jgi:hypothetical protein
MLKSLLIAFSLLTSNSCFADDWTVYEDKANPRTVKSRFMGCKAIEEGSEEVDCKTVAKDEGEWDTVLAYRQISTNDKKCGESESANSIYCEVMIDAPTKK